VPAAPASPNVLLVMATARLRAANHAQMISSATRENAILMEPVPISPWAYALNRTQSATVTRVTAQA
jgi:hypothetical protein